MLDRFSKRERDEMDVAIEVAADAVETIVREGAEAAMTKFNARA
ncbi:MAG TPA: hypothetical protein VI916_11450 [Acidimicrobiia bacterium]|nr:hypothetical protein [Acidimicrobiia bacterium]